MSNIMVRHYNGHSNILMLFYSTSVGTRSTNMVIGSTFWNSYVQ